AGVGGGFAFFWTSVRGRGRVGASRGRSAAGAADIAALTSYAPSRSLRYPLARPRGAPTRPRPRTDSQCLALAAPLGRVACLGFVGVDFCKDEGLAGSPFLSAYGRAQKWHLRAACGGCGTVGAEKILE